MSPATDTTLVSSIILPTYKRPLEAPWPPAVGPIETLHLCAVRLSCLEKVGSAIYAACVSRANRSEETDHSNKWRSTFPDLPVSSLWLLCCSHAVCHSSRGCYSRFIYKGSGGKTGRCAWRGNVTFSVGATVWWDCDRAGERNMRHIPSARRARASDLFRINVL